MKSNIDPVLWMIFPFMIVTCLLFYRHQHDVAFLKEQMEVQAKTIRQQQDILQELFDGQQQTMDIQSQMISTMDMYDNKVESVYKWYRRDCTGMCP